MRARQARQIRDGIRLARAQIGAGYFYREIRLTPPAHPLTTKAYGRTWLRHQEQVRLQNRSTASRVEHSRWWSGHE